MIRRSPKAGASGRGWSVKPGYEGIAVALAMLVIAWTLVAIVKLLF